MEEQEDMKRIDRRIIQVSRLSGWISFVVYVVIDLILLLLTLRFDWPWWIVAVAAAASLIALPIEVILVPQFKYRTWRYALHEHDIELHHGIWVRKRTLIPYVRVQHVDASQGPLLKRYGLSTVTFSTAAGSHSIPALSEETAERVRKQIATIARIADDDGL